MTRADHPTGTDRLAEVARGLDVDVDVIVNVQGDMPLLDPAMVERLAARMAAEPDLPMATLAAPLDDEAAWRSPHVVKVVVGRDGRALYFSRSPLPYRNGGGNRMAEPLGWHHHRPVRPTAATSCSGSRRSLRRRSSSASSSSSSGRWSTGSRSVSSSGERTRP